MTKGTRIFYRAAIVFWVVLFLVQIKLAMSPFSRMPLWVLALPFIGMLAPTIALQKDARQRKRIMREEHGLCIKCGYDLRARRDQCPECGTVPAQNPCQ
jgi:hypothetical protein